MSTASEPVRPNLHDNIMMTGEDAAEDSASDDGAGDDLFAPSGQEGDKRDEAIGEAEEKLAEAVDENPEDIEGEAEPARVPPDPGEPTPCQVEEHRANGHVPFRSWCKHCVAGRSDNPPH